MTDRARRDIGPWVLLPEWVMRRGLSAWGLRLYCELAVFADNRTGACWPSHATLADRMGCSSRTVERAQAELQAEGCVLIENRRDDAGSLTSNLYTVLTLDPLGTDTVVGTSRQDGRIPTDTGVGVTRPRELETASIGKRRLGPQGYRDPECPECGGSGVRDDSTVCDCFLANTA